LPTFRPLALRWRRQIAPEGGVRPDAATGCH
jgi:hypothetical protein